MRDVHDTAGPDIDDILPSIIKWLDQYGHKDAAGFSQLLAWGQKSEPFAKEQRPIFSTDQKIDSQHVAIRSVLNLCLAAEGLAQIYVYFKRYPFRKPKFQSMITFATYASFISLSFTY